jgi:pimeloyl-ACP methyl ester carboxylesterase
MRIAIGVVLALLSCTTAGAQGVRDEYLTVGAQRLHVRVYAKTETAHAAPTIVLESGGGFDAQQWEALQPRLGDELEAVVVAYDRPGFGSSDLPATPYDIREEVANLHSALTQLDLADRVVIVAHSYGALLAQLYAASWPKTVAGLVFLDPNSAATTIGLHELQTRPLSEKPPQTPREKAFARIDAAIWDTLTAVYRSPLPKEVPLTVVSAERGFMPEERYNEAFRLTHRLLVLAVVDGRHVIAEGSNHMIPAQRPDVVVDGVKDILARARKD